MLAAQARERPQQMRGNCSLKGKSSTRLPPISVFRDRKSTRLNSSHLGISYAVFCLKKKRVLIHSDSIGRRGGMVRAGSKKLEWVLPTITVKMIPFFFIDRAPPEIYPLPLHAALPI